MATISENIKRIRTKQGLTQDDLAKGGHQILYPYKIEGGVVTKPSVQTIQKNRQVVGRSYGGNFEIIWIIKKNKII